MRGTISIRLKAALLSVIFTGNFLVVCHCSATASGVSGMAMHRECCCHAHKTPCKKQRECPGTKAVKFNLMEREVAASVHAGPVAMALVTHMFVVPVVVSGVARRNYSNLYLSLHAPPDRLAFYHCYLI